MVIRYYLILSPQEAELPERWRLADVLDATSDFCNLPKETKRDMISTLARLGIRNLRNLSNIQNQGGNIWEQHLARVRGIPEDQMRYMMEFVRAIALSQIIPEGERYNGAGAWTWIGAARTKSSYNLPNDQAYSFLLKGGKTRGVRSLQQSQNPPMVSAGQRTLHRGPSSTHGTSGCQLQGMPNGIKNHPAYP
jgi:hypothetical protein